MKQVLSLTGILALSLLFSSAISIMEAPQDPPKTKKGKKHIKMVKVGDDGKKMEIDTVITADQIFVWNGDTIEGGKGLKWVSEEDFDFDMDIDVDVETDENGNVIIMKGDGASESMIYEFKTNDGDSTKHIMIKAISDDISSDMMKWHSKNGNEMFFGAPRSSSPKVIRIDKQKSGNVIDLSDPGIISYDRKELRNGKEKIVIVREKPSEEDVEVHEEIIMHGGGSAPMILHSGHSNMSKKIKIIADDEGRVEILEDGKTWTVEESDEDTQVIEKDGKKIIIKKTKKDGEMKVDVEVEEKEN
ncbi:hypothetical protein [Draconibacterium halophilum]|uniref:Uncharacterized protein n=1 Tax=Draconibacterium halophilum TaxID=2706887 RepID=A0A6C0RHB6_9BACT|nr:hypothetical protein [Draconibacterium halophilum]QIA09830.1 hypothetical protein G0Q07_19935 [Draconibacterium halophilum]